MDKKLITKKIGQKIRAIRKERGLSLKEIERLSRRKHKASAMGAYERSERKPSLPKLYELSEFFQVPVNYFLVGTDKNENRIAGNGVKIDLEKTKAMSSEQREALLKYVEMILEERGERSNANVAIRKSDLLPLALAFETNPYDLTHMLEEKGIISTVH